MLALLPIIPRGNGLCRYQKFILQKKMSQKTNKKRKLWKDETMAAAVKAVKDKQIGYLKAAKEFQVPRTTLFRLCQNNGTPEPISNTKLGRPPVFSRELES
ncbi:CENP-B N-terminal DNA-binding domain [Popillia japonica]|uniref:CENP-B N-terminal DNA-binding domain n=1 Tax=Popillia japonica TaxID=7064 RepID=A0AAW1HTI4_POPJA